MLDIAQASIGLPRRGLLQTQKPMCGNAANCSAGYTFCMVLSVASLFSDVRPLFANYNTAASITLTKVAIAPTAKYNDGVNPVDAAGNPISWTPVTFSGAASVTLAAASGSNPNYLPTIATPDWPSVDGLARADSGEMYPLVMVRVYFAATGNLPTHTTAEQASFTARTKHICNAFYVSGDKVTNGDIIVSPTAAAQSCVWALQTISQVRGIACAAYGDSLTGGFEPSLGAGRYPFAGWLSRACSDLSVQTFPGVAGAIPFSFINNGWQGRNTTTTYAAFLADIDILKPDVAFLSVYSPNDNALAFPAQFRRAMRMAYECQARGIIPVLVTPQPWSYTGAAETSRLDLVARVKASGLLYADIAGAVTDPANPNKVLPAYAAPDTNHLSLGAGGGQDVAAEAAKLPLRLIASTLLGSGMPT